MSAGIGTPIALKLREQLAIVFVLSEHDRQRATVTWHPRRLQRGERVSFLFLMMTTLEVLGEKVKRRRDESRLATHGVTKAAFKRFDH